MACYTVIQDECRKVNKGIQRTLLRVFVGVPWNPRGLITDSPGGTRKRHITRSFGARTCRDRRLRSLPRRCTSPCAQGVENVLRTASIDRCDSVVTKVALEKNSKNWSLNLDVPLAAQLLSLLKHSLRLCLLALSMRQWLALSRRCSTRPCASSTSSKALQLLMLWSRISWRHSSSASEFGDLLPEGASHVFPHTLSHRLHKPKEMA